MKKIVLILLLLINLEAANKQILLLQSYNKGLKWSDDLSKGVEEVLINYKRYELTTQYMDSKKYHSKDYINALYNLFLQKYKYQQYDVVIVADNYAIDFVLKYKNKIFKNSKLVFCGLDKDLPGINVKKALKEHIPVVLENKQLNTNIEYISKILPNLKELYLINDLSLSSRLINKKFEESTNKINKKLNISLSLHGNLKKIENDLLKLPENSAILFGSLFIDEKGKYIPYYQVNDLINKSTVPVFSLTDSHLGKGVIGGKLSTGYEQGKEAAKLAIKFLEKKYIDFSKPVTADALWYFDYKVLKKYNLENIKLPDNATIINSPKSFFEKYNRIINIIFIIFPFILITLIIAIISIILKTKAQKKLEAQKKLSEAQLNNLESSIFWIDTNGKIKGCNSSFNKFVKRDSSQIINKDIDNIFLFLKKYISKEKIFNYEQFEFNYLKKDYLVKNKYVEDENRNLEAVTIITNITEKKQAEINKQFLIQQSKLTEIGETLSALVHQWKTPLVELSAVAHKMHYYNKKKRLNDKDIDDFYNIIMKQTVFMSETMDSFRGFIKASNKAISFDISLGISEILDILKDSLKYNNIQAEYINVLEKNIFIHGYPNEFKQVILNLINNAKDSILEKRKKEKSNIQGEIKIILTQIEESVKIKIVDDGLGFTNNIENKIFNPYFTTKNDGIGIGLYMAKLIIENKMNGIIKAYNNIVGAKFIITLPKDKENDENLNS